MVPIICLSSGLNALCAPLWRCVGELVAATGFGTFSPFRQIGFVAVRIVSSLHCGGRRTTVADPVAKRRPQAFIYLLRPW
jgi:hypothetical protein